LRRKTLVISSTVYLALIILMIGCAKKYNYATDEPFVIATSYSAGPDDYRNMYDRNISIDQDGNLVLYTTGNSDIVLGADVPMLEVQLDEEQVIELEDVIQEQKFLSIQDDVSTPSEDGGYGYVTVNLENKSKEVGGLNPDNSQFIEVHRYIFSLVDDDDFKDWEEEVEEYIWEMNSLRTNEKTDYHEEEPFLILSLERYWGGSSQNVYYHNILIDLDGNLVVSADESAYEYIEDDGTDSENRVQDVYARTIEMQVDDKKLKKLQELIQMHFWKLNESITNSDGGNKRESITVQLTDEAKRVRGSDPDHHRFLAIRDEIIDILDEEAYEAWEEEVNEDLWEKNELNSNKKTDYSEDEPFLILNMEEKISEESIYRYYHQVSINMDGKLVLAAEMGLGVEIDDDAPVIEKQLNENELEKVKELIEAHFWKLEDFNYGASGERQMDEIIIHLTDDTIGVRSNNPDDDKFLSIRNEVINLIDEDARKAWEKEIEKHISE